MQAIKMEERTDVMSDIPTADGVAAVVRVLLDAGAYEIHVYDDRGGSGYFKVTSKSFHPKLVDQPYWEE